MGIVEIIRIIEEVAIFCIPIIIVGYFIANISKIRKLKKNKAIIKKSLIVWTVILGIMSVLITAFIIYMIIIIIGITSGAIRLM